MPRTHHLSDEPVHYTWDTGNEPVLMIESGDTVALWTRDVSDNQIGPDSEASALASFDWDRAYPLTGPIGVHGAEPGDALKVEMLDVHALGWGWTGVIPGTGLLAEDFPDAYLRTFDLADGDAAYLREDIAIPLAPYFGTMGVCPAGASARPVLPPGRFGGNMISARPSAARRCGSRWRSIPPRISAAQVKGFTLWATRSVLTGRGDEVVEVARTSLRELSR
jgi:acetamidase/formamidase